MTRPAPQARRLGELIAKAGGHAIEFPTIRIQAVSNNAHWITRLRQLGTVDWYIYVSTNAVKFGVPLVDAAGINTSGVSVASMGAATSEALIKYHVNVSLECPAPVSSESLLATAAMRRVEDQRVVIFRGVGGRELLRQGLCKLGASVDYIECYQRTCPKSDPGVLRQAKTSGQLDVIVTTSVDGLCNLMHLVENTGDHELFNTDLVVAGGRQAEEARRRGWRGRVIAADDAGDPAILQKLEELAKQ